MLPIITTIAANVLGSALGKMAGKAAEWVPNPDEYRRNKISSLEKEQDEKKKEPESFKRDARLHAIAHELSALYKQAVNK